MPIMIVWAKTEAELAIGPGLEVVSAAVAAGKLGVSEARLRQLSLAGAIKHVDQFAKARLYLLDDVEKLRATRSAG